MCCFQKRPVDNDSSDDDDVPLKDSIKKKMVCETSL